MPKEWKGRLLKWFMRCIWEAIPAGWLVWTILGICDVTVEVQTTGSASWESILLLFIRVYFSLGFIKQYLKKDLDD